MTVDEQLTEEVRVYPFLYDKSKADFKDRNKRYLAWQDVAEKLQSWTKPLEKIHKTRIFNLNVGKQLVKTFSHTPLPHTMLLLDGTFCSTLNGGRRGLGILHQQPICEK